MSNSYTLDNVPLNKFHIKVVGYTLGGSFIDGYILGVISIALVLIIPVLHLSSVWQGLIGSSPMIGIFIGALVFGKMADRIGRRQLYTLDFLVIIIASALQYFVEGAVFLFILRLILGIAIGAEYCIGPSLQAEFMPIKYRGPLLSLLNIFWILGFCLAATIAFFLEKGGPDSWRWILVSSAVPAVIVFIARIGAPESPRWLIQMGRIDEARAVVKKHIGENVSIDNLIAEHTNSGDSVTKIKYRDLFSKSLWRKTLFVCIFWGAAVIAVQPIFTFAPRILETLDVQNELLSTVIIDLFTLVGAIVGMVVIDLCTRKFLLISTSVIAMIPLLILAFYTNASGLLTVGCFCAFLFVFTIGSTLQFVWPVEIFPTELRASGTGFASAMTRVVSAISIFVFPVATEHFGISVVLIAMVVVIGLAIVAALAWAPDTRFKSLS